MVLLCVLGSGAVLGALEIARRFAGQSAIERRVIQVAPYAIGSLAGFWFVERVVGFWA